MFFSEQMIETKLPFRIDIGDILDVDFTPEGRLISIQGFGKRHVLKVDETAVDLPAEWAHPQYPHLRYLQKNRHLLIDIHANTDGNNALIVNDQGKISARFHLGAGVVDACPTAGMIAVAYHADAAFEFGLDADPLAALGVAIFDQSGQIIACLNHELERLGYRVENIQCLVPRESGELLVVPDVLTGPDGEFTSPVIFYDWRMGHVRWEETGLSQPLAISSKGSQLYIYSPQEADENIIRCDLTGSSQRTLGFYKNLYRGLPGGRFLGQVSPTEYQILEPSIEQTKIEYAEPKLLRLPTQEI